VGTCGGGGSDAFVTNVNAAGSALVYSTYLGGSGTDFPVGIAVDSSGNTYVTGHTTSTNFPKVGAIGAACVGTCGSGGFDAFVSKIGGAAGGGGGGCPPHTVHGHISTVPPSHSGSVSHQHHGQHGHTVAANCPPHAPGHSAGLSAEPAETQAVFSPSLKRVRRGDVLPLYGPAEGVFLDDQDTQPAATFTPPTSGSPLFYTTRLPEVRIGGVTARVLFSGLAPGLTGVWQINVLVPAEVAAGSLPVTISYEGDELRSIDLIVE